MCSFIVDLVPTIFLYRNIPISHVLKVPQHWPQAVTFMFIHVKTT